MIEVDPQFHQSREMSKRREIRRRIRIATVIGGGSVAVFVLAALLWWLLRSPDTTIETETAAATGPTGQFVQVEDTAQTPAPRIATPFVDIAGDPMILRFDTDDAEAMQTLAGDPALDVGRFGLPGPNRFSLLVEDLVVQERQLMTALPSSREDFAFFQAQRSRSLDLEPTLPALITTPDVATGEQEGERIIVDDDGGSWGEAIADGSTDGVLSYVSTQIQNTTSVAFLRPEAARSRTFSDVVLRLVRPRPLAELLRANGIDDVLAQDIAKTATAELPSLVNVTTDEGLAAGTIVAFRYRENRGSKVPLQVTIYGKEGYIGSLARRRTTGYAVASNPWLDEDLPTLARSNQSQIGQVQDFRLLDAIYSAAIRRGVSTATVGELIVMMSQAYDLESFANPGDKISILYAPLATGGPGQIAFAGISGPSGEMPCYVARTSDDAAAEYGCFSQRGLRGGQGQDGFVTPVNGTLSSGFGPRFHPIMKAVRLHAGVDWAAPMGTPVVSALDGVVKVAGNGGGYGNVIYVDHADGVQTRYAHLDRFAPVTTVGATISAGDVIGYVGTTGRSTGPHLHFEVRRNGAPIDPFTLGETVGGGVVSAAVEALTDQIIRVESGGNANAKNPMSTAVGLGQFIESTWLRMMRDYRPDLAGTMSRPALLALRTDPTLSREMIQNLARENENFLRARGHDVDAGRLYLAHFLGPGGAHKVLSAPDDKPLLPVVGRQVVHSNDFLTGFTVAELKNWAQRKMRSMGSVPSAPRSPPVSPEVRAYIKIIDRLLAQAA